MPQPSLAFDMFSHNSMSLLSFIKISTALQLYREGKISLQEACEFSSLSEELFLEAYNNPDLLNQRIEN